MIAGAFDDLPPDHYEGHPFEGTQVFERIAGHSDDVGELPDLDRTEPAPVLEALAQDVSLWDQLGCLSPVAVYALGDPDGWARGLAEALADWASRVPRGEVPLEAAAATQRERDGAELRRGLDDQIDLHTGRDWTVVREAHADWRKRQLELPGTVFAELIDAARALEATQPGSGSATIALPREALYAYYRLYVFFAEHHVESGDEDAAVALYQAVRVCETGTLDNTGER